MLSHHTCLSHFSNKDKKSILMYENYCITETQKIQNRKCDIIIYYILRVMTLGLKSYCFMSWQFDVTIKVLLCYHIRMHLTMKHLTYISCIKAHSKVHTNSTNLWSGIQTHP